MYPHQIIDLAAKGDGGFIGVGFVFDITGGAQLSKHLALNAALLIAALFLDGSASGRSPGRNDADQPTHHTFTDAFA